MLRCKRKLNGENETPNNKPFTRDTRNTPGYLQMYHEWYVGKITLGTVNERWLLWQCSLDVCVRAERLAYLVAGLFEVLLEGRMLWSSMQITTFCTSKKNFSISVIEQLFCSLYVEIVYFTLRLANICNTDIFHFEMYFVFGKAQPM